MLYAIPKGMYQNVVALHPANGMSDKDADATLGRYGSLLLIAQLRLGVLLTLARLLGRDVNPITPIVSSNTKIAEIDTDIHIGTPIQLRGKLLFQHEGVVMVTTGHSALRADSSTFTPASGAGPLRA